MTEDDEIWSILNNGKKEREYTNRQPNPTK
jgi:hypothetical protein